MNSILMESLSKDETVAGFDIGSRSIDLFVLKSGRAALLDRLISEYAIGGVVGLTWHCCHTYNIELRLIGYSIEKGRDLPFFHVETDYSRSD